MLAYIKGELMYKQPPQIIIVAAGVGYEIDVPMTAFYQLPELGEQAELFLHHSVREDAQTLFGFASLSDRDLFREVIKVNGIGPRLALAMLSALDAPTLIAAIANADVDALVKIPGIGKKTAERIVLDLRDKLADKVAEGIIVPAANAAPVRNEEADAISALVSLGYKQKQAEQAVKLAAQEGLQNSEDLIRASLRSLS